MARLTLCVIMRNEAEEIAACVESARAIVSEILLIDTGSTDRTVEIALALPGASVHTVPWSDDFSKARNAALERATGDYILFLDADERLSVKDHPIILEALTLNPFADAFRLPIRNYTYSAAEIGWQAAVDYRDEFPYPGYVPTALCRLFRNDPEIRYEGIVHELIEPSLQRGGKLIEDLNVPIHHLGKIREVERRTYRMRYETYLQIHQKSARENPESAKAFFELGVNYMMLEDFSSARSALERALEIEPFFPEAIKHLCIALLKSGNYRELLERVTSVSQTYSADPDYHLFAALALLDLGEREEAEKELTVTLQINPDLFLALVSLTELRIDQSDLAGAAALLNRLEELNPTDPVVAFNRARLLDRAGQGSESLAILETLDPELREWRASGKQTLPLDRVLFELGKGYIKAKRYEEAERVLLEAHALRPGSAPICIALATAYGLVGRRTQAAEYVDRAAMLDPAYEALSVALARA